MRKSCLESTYKEDAHRVYEGLDGVGGGSGIHYSLKVLPIIHLIKFFWLFIKKRPISH